MKATFSLLVLLAIFSQTTLQYNIRPQTLDGYVQCMEENCAKLADECHKDSICTENNDAINELFYENKSEDCVKMLSYFQSADEKVQAQEFPAINHLNCLKNMVDELPKQSSMSNKMYQCNCLCGENPESSSKSECPYLQRKVPEQEQKESENLDENKQQQEQQQQQQEQSKQQQEEKKSDL